MSYANQITSFFFCGFILCLSLSTQAQIDTLKIENPASGITYVSLVDSTQPWHIHLLEINLQQAPAELHSHKALPDGDPGTPTRQTLPEMWNQLKSDGYHPIAGINADFFSLKTGDPINIQISDHQPIFVPYIVPKRSQFGISADGTPFIGMMGFSGTISINDRQTMIDGVNILPPQNGLSLVEHRMDSLPDPADSLLIVPLQRISNNGSSGESRYLISDNSQPQPPLLMAEGRMRDSLRILQEAGDTLNKQFQFPPNPNGNSIEELVGGAVQLMDDGKQVIDQQIDIEGVSSSFASDRHPRTAVGFSDEYLYMVVVDGRQKQSAGMSLYELAEFMSMYEITEALNLDGGGSTTIMVNGEIVNSPSDLTGARPVSNALFLIEKPSR